MLGAVDRGVAQPIGREAEADRRLRVAAAARRAEQDRVLAQLGSPRFAAPAPLPGLALDVWSTTDDPSALTGSDLVSASRLPDGRVLLLMVDAIGSGLTAVRDAWQVMYACRAHMAAGAALAEMIGRCADILACDGHEPRATILGICLDPETRHLQAASGGHPPPLLVHRDGTAAWVEAAGRGLGDPRPGSHSLAEAVLRSGDSLVLYSDGVVDGGQDVIANLSALRSGAVALRAQGISGVAHRIARSVGPSSLDGDATLVVARLGDAGPTRSGLDVLHQTSGAR